MLSVHLPERGTTVTVSQYVRTVKMCPLYGLFLCLSELCTYWHTMYDQSTTPPPTSTNRRMIDTNAVSMFVDRRAMWCGRSAAAISTVLCHDHGSARVVITGSARAMPPCSFRHLRAYTYACRRPHTSQEKLQCAFLFMANQRIFQDFEFGGVSILLWGMGGWLTSIR